MKLRLNRTKIIIGSLLIIILIFVVNLLWFRPFFIKHFFYTDMMEGLKNDPETATKVKVPFLYGKYKDQLNDQSIAAVQNRHNETKRSLKTLQSYNDKYLNSEKRLSKQIISWHLQKNVEGFEFKNHKYLLNPYNGLQNSLPSYLDTYHYIENQSDAKAYLKRLQGFADYYIKVLERVEESRIKKIVPPEHILEATVLQMEKFISMAPDKNMLFTSFQQKLESCDEINNKETLLQMASNNIENYVYPAYFRMINYCRDLKKEANQEDGIWSLPEGDAWYQFLLKHHTTLKITPEEIHQTGLRETARIKNEMVAELKKLGYDTDLQNLMNTLKELKTKPEFILGNSIEGRYKCLAKYDSLIQYAYNSLEDHFSEMPHSGLEVVRVPEFKQEGASNAYYEVPTMDGNGKGSFYVRLDNLDQNPVYEMPTLAYHEGIPGHHYQLALHLEKKSIPIYRKRYYNNAYIEGWALYAERLMYELGAYQNDSYGNIGRLQAELVRAARLVADSGIHFKKWNKEVARNYLEANSGLSSTKTEQEVDRYIADPGQACSYTIGFLKILELRSRMAEKLGESFNLKDFHSVVLSEGMVPLEILEQLINQYIENELSQGSKK